MMRRANIERVTGETRVSCTLWLPDAPRQRDPSWGVVPRPPCVVDTGIGFLDHMLGAMAFHGGFGLELRCRGDVLVDDHHSAEDCAITLGMALRQALGDKAGIARFGQAFAPLDEALARAVVDLSGRPHATVELGLRREALGALSCENLAHVVRSLANAAMATVHLDVLRGENDHHRAEAAFKALGLALAEAVALPPGLTRTADRAAPAGATDTADAADLAARGGAAHQGGATGQGGAAHQGGATGQGGVSAGVGRPEAGIGQPEAGIGQPEAGVGQPEAGIGQPEAGVARLPGVPSTKGVLEERGL